MKSKWFIASFKKSLRAFADCLQLSKYSEGKGVGFELLEVKGECVKVKFINRVVGEELIVDPYGNETSIETIRYDVYTFCVFDSSDRRLLKITDSPRSTRVLFKEIQKSNDGEFYIEPLLIEINSFEKGIKKEVGSTNMYVPSATASGIILNNMSSARVEVKSRKNAVSDLMSVFDKKGTLEKITLAIKYNGCAGKIEASRSGSIKYDKEHEVLVDKVINGLK